MASKKKQIKSNEELLHSVEVALKAAKRNGASSADASLGMDSGISVSVRNKKIETLEYHKDKGLGITVYIGQSKGTATTSNLTVSYDDKLSMRGKR